MIRTEVCEIKVKGEKKQNKIVLQKNIPALDFVVNLVK